MYIRDVLDDRRIKLGRLLIGGLVGAMLVACGGGSGGGSSDQPEDAQEEVVLTIQRFGQGQVRGDVSGLTCAESVCSNSYAKGQEVNLSAIADSGWELNNWAGCDSVADLVCTIDMSDSATVYPTFKRNTPVVLRDNVMELSADTVSKISSIQDGAIVFSSQATEMATVAVGTVLLSKEGEGFARKVTDVIALAGSSTTVATSDVPLEDVIGEGTVIYNTPLTNADVIDVEPVKGVRYVAGKASSPVLTFEVDVDVGEGVHVKGALDVQVTPDLAVDIGWSGLQEFKSAMEVTVKPLLTVSLEKDAELEREMDLPVPVIRFAPIVVGPLVIGPELRGKVKVTADAKAEISMQGWVQVTGKAGAHYIRSVGWRGIGKAGVTGSFDPVNPEASVGVDTMLGAEAAFKLYGKAGPALFVGPYASGRASFDPVDLCGAWIISAGGRAKASIKGKVLGWKIQSADLKLFDLGWRIAGGEYGNCDGENTLSQPETPVVVQTFSDAIGIQWGDAPEGEVVEKYEVYRNHELVAEVSGLYYFDDGLQADTRYCYYIVAVDSHGNRSPESGTVCGDTKSKLDEIPPTTPTGLVAQAVSSSAISLAWDPSIDDAGEVSYVIYQSGSTEIVGRSDDTFESLTRLQTATEYCYRVAAFDEAGNQSELSNQACATTFSAGLYRVRSKCAARSTYVVDTTMDLDETITSNVSVVGNANDYDGTPMSYVLSGVYDNQTRQLNGRIDWSFEGSTCYRADTFLTDLSEDDTGDVTMNQVSACGCTAQIRFTRGTDWGPRDSGFAIESSESGNISSH